MTPMAENGVSFQEGRSEDGTMIMNVALCLDSCTRCVERDLRAAAALHQAHLRCGAAATVFRPKTQSFPKLLQAPSLAEFELHVAG